MKKEITIPTSLHEITLEKYVSLVSVDLDNELEVKYNSIHAIYGYDAKVVDAMTQGSVDRLLQGIANITMQKYEPMYKFRIGGVWYGMIPDLTDEAVKFKEWTDMNMHIDAVLDGTLDPQSYQRFMAVMFRPIVKNENGLIEIEPYNGSEEHYEVMAKAPASAFKGAEAFFLSLREDLLECSRTYIREEQGEIQTLANHLRKNGDGMEVLETLLKQVEKQ